MQSLEEFVSLLKKRISQDEKIEIISYSTELKGFDIDTEGIEFFNSLPIYPRMYWSNTFDGTMLSFGKLSELLVETKNRYQKLDDFLSYLNSISISNIMDDNFGIKLFGGFSFSEAKLKNQSDIWEGFPNAYFFVPQILIENRYDQWIVTFNIKFNADELETIHERISKRKNQFFDMALTYISQSVSAKKIRIEENKPFVSYDDWTKNIEEIKTLFEKSPLQKLVLANSRTLKLSDNISRINALYYLHQNYPNAYILLFEPLKDNTFLAATPEVLISKNNNNLET
ncbi:MAG: chorismate-binding protein, partial [Candidatus Kariarchaeaceae archaeon]